MLNLNIQKKFKTIEEINQLAPSIFTPKKYSGTSKNYIHIPTDQIIQDMEILGWNVVDAKEVKCRKDHYKGYQKHLLVFRNPNLVITGKNGDDVYPQILISNSHDGKSAFVFRAGLYRLVCENGLVIAEDEFEKKSIRHMGYNFEELQITIKQLVEKLPLTVRSINKLKNTNLTQHQKEDFVEKAIKIRFNSGEIPNINEILTPLRKQDEGDDVWSIYNLIQEKIVNGMFNYRSDKGKIRKARKIKNFQQDIAVNEKLYKLALEYAVA